MIKKEYLKSKNTPQIAIFIIWCITLYITFLTSSIDYSDKIISTVQELRNKDGIFMALLPIVALVLNGLVSPENKARLVFWKYKYALPGHRVFSKLSKTDSRIDYFALLRRIGTMPAEPKDENSKWYSIYKQFADVLIVRESHKAFLLSRDLCSIAFVFTIMGSLSLLIYGQKLKWIMLYFGIMIMQYIILAIVAQNYGNRFVCNVIAEYTADNSI
ncbi:MAG: hypothetical protein ABII64_02855 [Elusimicrobiota bacterium]